MLRPLSPLLLRTTTCSSLAVPSSPRLAPTMLPLATSLGHRLYHADSSGVVTRKEGPETHPSHFDVCVIGCGPAGFAATMRAYDLRKRVCVIEKAKVGGTGLHNGALSSKALWEVSRQYKDTYKFLNCFEAGPGDDRNRGFEVTGLELDYEKVNNYVWRSIYEKQRQMEHQLGACKIPLMQGEARFVTPHRVDVLGHDGNITTVHASHFVIATGSKPREDPNIYTDGHVIMTSDHIQKNLTDFPGSLAIVGAGVVGCEFATIFANFGRTRVHIINRSSRVLPFEDKDISSAVEKKFQEKGVEIHHNSQVKSLKADKNKAHLVLVDKSGKEKSIVVDKALLSIGRVPCSSIPGMSAIGVQVNDTGAFVEKDTQTSIPHIYVVGDATAELALVNMAEIEARYAVNKMFHVPQNPLTYDNISKIMFVDPLTAGVGLNEQEASAARISHKIALFRYDVSGRAMIMGQTNGFIKLICSTEADGSKVLGARAMGPHASSLIGIISVMIHMGKPITELSESLKTAYPALLEGLHECARMMDNSSILKPTAFPKSLVMKEVLFEEGIQAQTA